MYLYVCICIYLCMRVYMYVCMYVRIYVYVCMYVSTYVCMYVSLFACMYVYNKYVTVSFLCVSGLFILKVCTKFEAIPVLNCRPTLYAARESGGIAQLFPNIGN